MRLVGTDGIMPLTRRLRHHPVFTFIFTWNDFMPPLIYLHSEDQATLPWH